MGAWGYGIFDDDLALDIRASFEEAIRGGASVEEATKLVLQEYGGSLDDPDEASVVYLVLAALQNRHGGLQDSIRRKALSIIAHGVDLARWEESNESVVEGRRRTLEELRDSLTAGPGGGPGDARTVK